jgi:hypothetical protein
MRGGVFEYLDPRYYMGIGPYSAATAAPAQVAQVAKPLVTDTIGTPAEQKEVLGMAPGGSPADPGGPPPPLTAGRRKRRTRKHRRSRR